MNGILAYCPISIPPWRRGQALSNDLRKRVVEAVVEGKVSCHAAAKRFKVSIAGAVRWVKQFETTGKISPRPARGDRRSGRIEAQRDYLLGLIRRMPNITLLEIQECLIKNCGESFFGFRAVALPRSSQDHKKKTAHAEEQQRAGMMEQRRDWFASQLDLEPTKLIFIDETGASTNLARKGGRSSRGRRLRGSSVPLRKYRLIFGTR